MRYETAYQRLPSRHGSRRHLCAGRSRRRTCSCRRHSTTAGAHRESSSAPSSLGCSGGSPKRRPRAALGSHMIGESRARHRLSREAPVLLPQLRRGRVRLSRSRSFLRRVPRTPHERLGRAAERSRNACGRAAATSTAGRVRIGWWRGRIIGPIDVVTGGSSRYLRSSRISSARTWARCSSSPDRPRTQQTDTKRVSCLPEDCGESQEAYRGRGVGVSRVRQWCGCTDTDTRSCATPRTSCTAVGAFAPSGGRAHAGSVGQLHTDRVTEGRQEPP